MKLICLENLLQMQLFASGSCSGGICSHSVPTQPRLNLTPDTYTHTRTNRTVGALKGILYATEQQKGKKSVRKTANIVAKRGKTKAEEILQYISELISISKLEPVGTPFSRNVSPTFFDKLINSKCLIKETEKRT